MEFEDRLESAVSSAGECALKQRRAASGNRKQLIDQIRGQLSQTRSRGPYRDSRG